MTESADEIKRFPEWIALKEHIHNARRMPAIQERQIWWAALGENVGVEINGKSDKFSRPVLVFKKLSSYGFLAIPLTTQDHLDHPWFVPYEFQGKKCFASLAQIRVISVSRLYGTSIGQMSKADFAKICDGFENLYSHARVKRYILR